MPPKRRLNKTNLETSDARCSSEDESPDPKKVRWNSITTAEEVDSESEEPGPDRNKVISQCIVHCVTYQSAKTPIAMFCAQYVF